MQLNFTKTKLPFIPTLKNGLYLQSQKFIYPLKTSGNVWLLAGIKMEHWFGIGTN